MKTESKKVFRHRSKSNCFFVFKRFFKWRSYTWIKQNCRNGKFKTIRSFGREIYNNGLSLDDALELQIRSKDNTDAFQGPFQGYFGWRYPKDESKLPMQLRCTVSCEPSGRIHMHNPGRITWRNAGNRNILSVSKAS